MATKVEIIIGARDTTNGIISQVNRDLLKTQQQATTTSEAMKTMGTALVGAFSIGAVVSFGKSVIDAGMQTERMTNALAVATGSAAAAKGELKWVTEEANRLGLAVGTTAESYTKFSAAAMGTSLQGEGVRKVFTAISGATSVLGMTADQTNGVFTALGQMMSKGTVQAEELRGQLGERMPGAFQLAAKAMGVTTAELGKMLEKGEVIAADFLPKFADEVEKRFGKQIPDAMKSTMAEMNRMQNKWLELKQLMFDSGSVQAGASAGSGALDFGKKIVGAVGESKSYWTGMSKKAGVYARFLFGGSGTEDFRAELDAIDAMTEHSFAKWEERLGNIGGGTSLADKDTKENNLKQIQMLEATIVREEEAARQKEKQDLEELFTWQENRIQQLKEIEAEEKLITAALQEQFDFEQRLIQVQEKADAAALAASLKELDATTKQAAAIRSLSAEYSLLAEGYTPLTEAETRLNNYLERRLNLNDQLTKATLTKDITTKNGLLEQLALLDKIIAKTKDQAKAVEDLTLRQNLLNGATVGLVWDDATGKYKQIGVNDWQSQNQYQTDASLIRTTSPAATVSNPVGGSDVNSPWGTYWGGNLPMLAVGTPYVKSSGLAYLHQGEAVIPANQNRGGGGVTIAALNVTIAGNSTRDQAKELYRELVQLGARFN